jgi:hypothetical protein
VAARHQTFTIKYSRTERKIPFLTSSAFKTGNGRITTERWKGILKS